MFSQYNERAACVWFSLRGDYDEGVDCSYDCLDAVTPLAGHTIAGMIGSFQPEIVRDAPTWWGK